MMLGPAHVAVGAACYALTRHPIGFAAGLLLHPAIDLLGAYHPREATTRSRILLYIGCLCCGALVLRGNWLALAAGALAWFGADYAWVVRAIWPGLDRFNPHRLWWVKGWEARECVWGFWLELALTLGCTALAVLA